VKPALILCALFVALLAAGCAGPSAPDRPSASQPVAIDEKQTQKLQPQIEEPQADAENGVLLRMKFQKGAKYSREFTGAIDVQAVKGEASPPKEALQRSSLKMTYSLTVQSIENGIATLKIESTPLEVTSGGNKATWVPQGQSGEIVVDTLGRVRTDVEGIISGVQGVGFVPLPEKKVALGSEWKRVSSQSMYPFAEVTINERYIYRGREIIDKVACDRIDLVGTGSLPGMKLGGRHYFRTSDGSLYRAELTQTAVIDVPAENGAIRRARVSVSVSVRAK
jgi:hypothetical protein